MFCPDSLKEKKETRSIFEIFKGYFGEKEVVMDSMDYHRIFQCLVEDYRNDLKNIHGDRDPTEYTKGLRDKLCGVIQDIDTLLATKEILNIRVNK